MSCPYVSVIRVKYILFSLAVNIETELLLVWSYLEKPSSLIKLIYFIEKATQSKCSNVESICVTDYFYLHYDPGNQTVFRTRLFECGNCNTKI